MIFEFGITVAKVWSISDNSYKTNCLVCTLLSASINKGLPLESWAVHFYLAVSKQHFDFHVHICASLNLPRKWLLDWIAAGSLETWGDSQLSATDGSSREAPENWVPVEINKLNFKPDKTSAQILVAEPRRHSDCRLFTALYFLVFFNFDRWTRG